MSDAPPARPSRGVILLPGLGNNDADYAELAALLRQQGLAVEVAQVSRLDWSRNAAALTDGNWWRGTLKPRPAVDWCVLCCLRAWPPDTCLPNPPSQPGWADRLPRRSMSRN